MGRVDRHPNAPEADAMALRLPPHHVESEQSLLGALLIDNSAYDAVADVLREDDFYRDDHRRIFRHIARKITAGQVADVVTVAEAIDLANESDQTGGLAYLGEIANATPSAANARGYALVIADRALRRAIIQAADQVAAQAFQGGSTSALSVLDQAQARFMDMAEHRLSGGDPEPIQPALGEVVEDMETVLANGGQLAGLSTGFVDLDSRTNGLHPGQLVIVAARPSMGKTAFATNIAESVALSGKVAAVFSMEMSRKELAARVLASVGKLRMDALRTGKLTDEEWDALTVTLGKLHETNLLVDETGGLTVGQLRAKARRVLRRFGRLDLIVVDYLQLMEADRGAETRNAEITAISRGLKAVAKELHCPVIALSQLSRKVEERTSKRPILSDLRESGAIEQDADLILMLYRDEYYKPGSPDKGLAEVIIAKQRMGPTGDIRLQFDGEHSRFHNLAFGDVVREVARQGRSKGKGFDA